MALIDCFLPPLAFAAMLGSEPNLADTPFETARTDLDKLLDQAVETARRLKPDQADNALFAVCAFADEAVLDSAWAERGAWMRNKLQQVRFHTANAGVEFFERMEMLVAEIARDAAQDPPADGGGSIADNGRREVLEVYAACLTLGFRGKYNDDQGRIDELADVTLQHLLADSGLPEDKVFPEAYLAALSTAQISRLKPAFRTLLLFGGPLLLAAGLYTSYSLLLTAFVEKWLKALAGYI